MSGANSPGIGRLTEAIKRTATSWQMQSVAFDFGEIRHDFSLLCNTFDQPIPKSEYLICRALSGQGRLPKVKPGDRVLIACVGNDFVLIDIIYEASEVL